jgi:hypothetical protein
MRTTCLSLDWVTALWEVGIGEPLAVRRTSAVTMRSDGRISRLWMPNCQRFEFKLGINRQTDFRPSSADL